jgi:hypothetical protein
MGIDRSAEEAEVEDGPFDDEQTFFNRGLINRSAKAIGLAAFEDWSHFTITPEALAAVEKAAAAWVSLLGYLDGSVDTLMDPPKRAENSANTKAIGNGKNHHANKDCPECHGTGTITGKTGMTWDCWKCRPRT